MFTIFDYLKAGWIIRFALRLSQSGRNVGKVKWPNHLVSRSNTFWKHTVLGEKNEKIT